MSNGRRIVSYRMFGYIYCILAKNRSIFPILECIHEINGNKWYLLYHRWSTDQETRTCIQVCESI